MAPAGKCDVTAVTSQYRALIGHIIHNVTVLIAHGHVVSDITVLSMSMIQISQ